MVPVMMPRTVGDFGRVLHLEIGRLARAECGAARSSSCSISVLRVGHRVDRPGRDQDRMSRR